MKKLFVFGALALILLMIFGQTSSFDTQAREEDPEMSCLLFGNAGCHTLCLIETMIFYDNQGTVGRCDQKHRCRCNYWANPSLKINFEMRFDAEYVLQAIEQDDFSQYMHIDSLFQYPLMTADEYRKMLKPKLSPYQYHKLKANDQSIAARFYRNGQVDSESIRQFVSAQLAPVFQATTKYHFDVDYKENLRRDLENFRGEASLYNLTYEIRMSANPILETILKNHLEKYELPELELELDSKPPLRRIIRMAVINELIKRTNEMNEDVQDETFETLLKKFT